MEKLFLTIIVTLVFTSCDKERLFENQPLNINQDIERNKRRLTNESLAKVFLFPVQFKTNLGSQEHAKIV